MKNIVCGILIFACAAYFCAAGAIAEDSKKGAEKADTSYAFGMIVAEDLAEAGFEFNYNAFMRGFRDAMEKNETRLTVDEAMEKIQEAFAGAQAAYEASLAELGAKNLAEGEAFLAENGKRPGVTTTSSGLQYEEVSAGIGEMPGMADTVLVHYRGATIDGNVFDSTYGDDNPQGVPIEVPLYRVIPGWSEGLRMMKEGGKAKLYIPPNLAYGERGAGPAIGPNSVIIFDVELLAIVKPAEDSEEEDLPDD